MCRYLLFLLCKFLFFFVCLATSFRYFSEITLTFLGQTWKCHRKLIQPCFHINVLGKFVNVFSKCAEKLTESLEENCDINVVKFVNNTILDILHCECLKLKKYIIKRQKLNCYLLKQVFKNVIFF